MGHRWYGWSSRFSSSNWKCRRCRTHLVGGDRPDKDMRLKPPITMISLPGVTERKDELLTCEELCVLEVLFT